MDTTALDMHTCPLATDALRRVLQRLPPNEVACTARLLCKATATGLSSPQHRAVRLSQPIPPHAADWQCDEAALRQLSFRGKLGALSAAAATGCETNLTVAWRLVRPCLFTDSPAGFDYWSDRADRTADPGTAAVLAGHAHLLPWLVAHGVPLHPERTLEAAAEHCTLEALQRAWELLRPDRSRVQHAVVAAAARSRTPDAILKLKWLLQDVGCGLWPGSAPAVVAAGVVAAGGDHPKLARWMQAAGGYMSTPEAVLEQVLQHGSLDDVQRVWRWRQQGRGWGYDDEQGALDAPGAGEGPAYWPIIAATSKVEALAKLAWLREQRGEMDWGSALHAAVCHGGLGAVRFLLEGCGVAAGEAERLLAAAAPKCSDPEVGWLLVQRGVRVDAGRLYGAAAQRGDLAAVRRLAAEGGLSCAGGRVARGVVEEWPLRGTPGCSSGVEEDCLAAVQAVLEAGAEVEDGLVAAAARCGSLPLVQWLVDGKGCRLTAGALEAAAEGGSAAVLEWLAARGCPTAEVVGREYLGPAVGGDRGTLQLLRQLGVPWSGDALTSRERGADAAGGHNGGGLQQQQQKKKQERHACIAVAEACVLQWFVDNGMELDVQGVREAVQWRGPAVAREWLKRYLAGGHL